MSNRPTEESFLKDIATHRMHVVQDEGCARRIVFKQPNSNSMLFELVTFPGVLVYTGDMGTYVFNRLEDMFEFFRSGTRGDDPKLFINLPYWGERLIAIDRDGWKKFSQETFEAIVDEHVAEFRDEVAAGQITAEIPEAFDNMVDAR